MWICFQPPPHVDPGKVEKDAVGLDANNGPADQEPLSNDVAAKDPEEKVRAADYHGLF